MRTRRIHIVGASGAGVTTLGHAVADALAIPHHDTDDYFWLPTAPPYQQRRDVADRLRLMHEMFVDRPDWVLSGSLDDWGGSVLTRFDLVVFLYVPKAVRLHRLQEREAKRGLASGETEDGMWWASMSQVHVKDIPTAKELIDRMIGEARDIVRKRLDASLADKIPA